MSSSNEIAILDFGSQYTHLIARRIRELGVKSHIYPNDVRVGELDNAVGIVLSGGPRSVVNQPKLDYDAKLFDLGVPILGLCYGHQLTADHFGGRVESGQAREYGVAKLSIKPSPIFKHIVTETTVWMSHGDHVAILPKEFVEIASTGNDSIAAMANESKKIYGFQFHPEVHHSIHGTLMLKNFVFDICKANKNWTNETMLEEIKAEIIREANDKNVFLLISGGVDSTVAFALLEKTLGMDRVYGLHVDHGLMRQDESKLVADALTKIGLTDLRIYNAEDEMLDRLKEIYDPEEKRKIIGDFFVEITERVMKELNFNEKDWLLGQGTIYPDTIESGGTKHADKIKTHHNRVDKIQEMIARGLIIEPLKDLYKDEVREVGTALGLPESLISRHPFPGPGLAIRCLCAKGNISKPEAFDFDGLSLLKLPVKSVGVQGDERSYSHPAVIVYDKPVDWHELRWVAPQITNSHKEVNRVLLPVYGDQDELKSSKLADAYITKDRLDLLRKIDSIVNKEITSSSCAHIWQFPVVLVPFGHEKHEAVILRPVESKEAMTVSFAELPPAILQSIITQISALGAVDYIFYDLTNKPPGTIEWE